MSSSTFVLTPPPTIEKKQSILNHDHNIVPRSLLNDLQSTSQSSPTRTRTRTRRRQRPYYTLKANRPKRNSVIDINTIFNTPSLSKNLLFLQSVLNDCNNIIVVMGAGVSTHTGIPDFRSQRGLFSGRTDNKSLFDLNTIYSSPHHTLRFNQMINNLHAMSTKASPTPFHNMLDKLAKQGRLKRVYTQNIDALETKLPSFQWSNDDKFQHLPQRAPFPLLVQLHGTINYMQCNLCHQISKLDPNKFITDGHVNDEELIPCCNNCQDIDYARQLSGLRSRGVGKLRPKIVLYNELHPEGEEIANVINNDIRTKRVDCLMIVGTTLEIPGVQQLCSNLNKNLQRQRDSGRFVVIFISNELPNKKIFKLFQEYGFDLIVHGDCQNLSNLI